MSYRIEPQRSAQIAGFIGKVSLFLLLLIPLSFYVLSLNRNGQSLFNFQAHLAPFYKAIERHTIWLVLSLLFLPTFGFPLSPLLLLIGSLLDLKTALTICFLGIGFNLTFSYFFYQKCLNRCLTKLIFRQSMPQQLPIPSRSTSLRWCLLIQAIPHLPYTVQCYVLATLKEVQFWHYLGISWPIQFAWAIGCAWSGQAILSGQWDLTLLVLSLLILYGAYRLHTRYRKRATIQPVRQHTQSNPTADHMRL